MINLYYDNLSKGNGYDGSTNPPCNHEISITTHFEWCDIQYQMHDIRKNYLPGIGLNLYVIELFYVERLDELFSNIPRETIKFIIENNIKVLIYFPIEGFKFSLYDNWLLRLHQCFKKYGLADVKKYFLLNNLLAEEQYINFLTENPEYESLKFSKIFGYCYFHLEHYKLLQKRWQDPKLKKKETINLDNLLDKKKNFLSLNAKMRAHRLLLISELTRRNLVNDSYVSFLGQDGIDHPEISIKFAHNTLIKIFSNPDMNKYISSDMQSYLNNFVTTWEPTNIDHSTFPLDKIKIDPTHYEKSYFSIVTETGMEHRLRITEKTFKPLANYHPFLVVGAEGTLKYLRTLGYETFGEMFDEHYDEESNLAKRLLMIIDEAEKFCKLDSDEKNRRFKKVYDKLIHNHHMFFNVLPQKNIDEFKKIFNIIEHDN